ncbi:hypothetical protein BURMUCF2_A2293 [Burkholderia multivorans CF2]|nr:hypothetical protein BURMUCF2_A2293 [Burkholderia multivorans CF2]
MAQRRAAPLTRHARRYGARPRRAGQRDGEPERNGVHTGVLSSQ